MGVEIQPTTYVLDWAACSAVAEFPLIIFIINTVKSY